MGKMGAIIAACEPDWRFGGILAQEGERWTVSLGGYFEDQVPADESGFIEFARSLPKPEIFDVIKNAEPLSPILSYQFSTNQRRYYEDLPRFPEGCLVYGDALCSFNPIYAQGMTVACTEALTLRECLAKGSKGIGRRFFRAARRLIDIPWQIAVGSDLQHERVEGKRHGSGALCQLVHRETFSVREPRSHSGDKVPGSGQLDEGTFNIALSRGRASGLERPTLSF
jgi:hypothetical protein